MYQVVLSGVGGQGILTLADILGKAALQANVKIVGAETHGMAQRGGSVIVHLRFGAEYAPLIMEGTADMLVSLEPAEALRYSPFISPQGTIILSKDEIIPTSLTLAHKDYPDIDPIIEALKHHSPNVYPISYKNVLKETTGTKSLNIAVLGSMTELWKEKDDLKFLSDDLLLQIIEKKWPKYYEINLKAFSMGKNLIKDLYLVH